MSDIMPPMPPLSKVRQPLFVEVRQQLVADLEARYQPGDRLAAEPELAVERVIRADDVPAAHALDVIPETALGGAGDARYEGGPAFVWTWPVVAAGQILVALVLAERAGRLPLSGYAFQWTSRLRSSHYGWFVGWAGLMAFIPGFTGGDHPAVSGARTAIAPRAGPGP